MRYSDTNVDRRLANIVQIGTVTAVDAGQGLAQVACGEPNTGWISWTQTRCGADREWWAPSVGEQVVLVAPSGELSGAIIIGSLFQDAHPAPAQAGHIHRQECADGTVIEYDRQTHAYLIHVGSGQVTIVCDQATVKAQSLLTLDAPQTVCTGMLTVQQGMSALSGATLHGGMIVEGGMTLQGGKVMHDGKDIGATHQHGGVKAGGDTTGAPV